MYIYTLYIGHRSQLLPRADAQHLRSGHRRAADGPHLRRLGKGPRHAAAALRTLHSGAVRVPARLAARNDRVCVPRVRRESRRIHYQGRDPAVVAPQHDTAAERGRSGRQHQRSDGVYYAQNGRGQRRKGNHHMQ